MAYRVRLLRLIMKLINIKHFTKIIIQLFHKALFLFAESQSISPIAYYKHQLLYSILLYHVMYLKLSLIAFHFFLINSLLLLQLFHSFPYYTINQRHFALLYL